MRRYLTAPAPVLSACAVVAVVAAVLVGAAPAQAARTQLTMMEDSTQLLTLGDGPRNFALDQFKALGTDVVKVRVEWRDIAPDAASRRKPAFDATDPAAYPAGSWDALDAAV